MRWGGSRDSSVGISTAGCTTDESRFVSRQEQEIYFCGDQRNLVFGWYWGLILGVKLIAHLRLVPRLSMRGAVPCTRAVLPSLLPR